MIDRSTILEELVPFATYCNSLTKYSRLETIEVQIGNLKMGGNNPIRLQSMTISDTMNTNKTVEEAIRMIKAGCELVRITAPSKNEALNLENIKAILRSKGFSTPLVADIHFTPNAAEIAARIVEKVRINPGNFVDKKKFETITYTDETYKNELKKIEQKFTPLVLLCKKHKTALRIGTNHGSLSDRIMSRYGDTPAGMVESALEFIEICEANDFDQIVISMKAANPIVMVSAYRLLAHTMLKRNKIYPIHLGVTEAGEGEDGRIKSAIGIGALLIDGIGDTIRVSLTEPAEYEIPVAKAIVNHIQKNYAGTNNLSFDDSLNSPINPYTFNRRNSKTILNLGSSQVPRVISDFSQIKSIDENSLASVGHIFDPITDKWIMTDTGTDIIYSGKQVIEFMLPNGVYTLTDYEVWLNHNPYNNAKPFFQSIHEWEKASKLDPDANFVQITIHDINTIQQYELNNKNIIFILKVDSKSSAYEYRYAIFKLIEYNILIPIILKLTIDIPEDDYENSIEARFQIASSIDLSIAVVDGLIDGIWLTTNQSTLISPKIINQTTFNILQASRQRITKTEYISCPSCGRTLFDLQETTANIRKHTEHLKGIKIAVMGCIVNGPGEMADADYGYVGAGLDLISLYRGKEMVEKGVKTEVAVQKLIELIQADGKWLEPPAK